MSIFILGSTGLVGGFVLQSAIESSAINSIVTLSRSAPKVTSPKLKTVLESDTEKWGEAIAANAVAGSTFISAFGTTRAKAGGIENFIKIDHGVNYEAAKAAKKSGVETFILVSSMGANANSWFPYLKAKGRLENDIIDLKFPRLIVLRPGALIGKRQAHHGFANEQLQWFAEKTYGTPFSFLMNGIFAEDIGKIAIDLASSKATSENEVRIIGGSELIQLANKVSNRN